jgi:hypothetical protein
LNRVSVILAGLFLLAGAAAAADLRGIYVDSNAFPISQANAAALTQSFSVPGVDGLVLVLGWDGLEPAMGQYDWSTLDHWMNLAASANKKVELSIRADYHTPSWLFAPAPGGGGARPLAFSFTRKPSDTTCLSSTIAAPWDAAFLAQWDAMLAAVAAHLKSTGEYGDVVLLRLTGINKDSDELHLPGQSSSAACATDSVAIWQQAGYRPSLLLAGWDGTTGSFKKSFPDKSFSVGETTPCTAETFLVMLETGIYPLGRSNPLRAQYIEVFALNVNDFPSATLQAHDELLTPAARRRAVRH